MATVDSEWLTVAEASGYLKVTRATLYRWAKQGKLRLYRLGNRGTRVRRSELDAALTPQKGDSEWVVLGCRAFAEDWDNDKDAVYDNWRQIYNGTAGGNRELLRPLSTFCHVRTGEG